MAKNKNLNAAARAKKDKFYTQRADIEHELQHYTAHFADKVVLCNCDDPFESQFFFYFAMNFKFLKLRKLIVTSYTGSPVQGDFRSKECVAALREADIVATNPPFSLFREFVKRLVDANKKFLIIGNINCITYKEIFPLIMANKIWLGYGMGRAIKGFIVPEGYELYGTEARMENGKRIVATNQCLWLTNLEHDKLNRPYDLVFSYEENPERYPRYDNYDAIEVSKTGDIPYDYYGVMGVPITFLDKYCPEQFELLGISYKYDSPPCHIDGKPWETSVNGKNFYKRLFIRRRR